jgi:predicted adenine nucleotide alpha hydrolase (AANH) superfamily ATPase
MKYLLTDAAILREIEETPTRPEDVQYIAIGTAKAELVKQVRRLEKDGRLYRKKWHGLTVYGVEWYPQGKTDDGLSAKESRASA